MCFLATRCFPTAWCSDGSSITASASLVRPSGTVIRASTHASLERSRIGRHSTPCMAVISTPSSCAVNASRLMRTSQRPGRPNLGRTCRFASCLEGSWSGTYAATPTTRWPTTSCIATRTTSGRMCGFKTMPSIIAVASRGHQCIVISAFVTFRASESSAARCMRSMSATKLRKSATYRSSSTMSKWL